MAESIEETTDPEVLAFRVGFDGRSPLDELVRQGARQMLQAALESEVQTFLHQHTTRADDQGRRLVVRNGSLPARQILTGAGLLESSQPRVRDNSPEPSERVRFRSSILPAYLRKSKSIEELIPWVHLKGVSTGEFSEALQALVDPAAKDLSADVIVRLKESWSQEYHAWMKRDLFQKQYVFVWADGIQAQIRLTMMFKLAQSAQKRGRRLNGHEQIVPLRQGKLFQDGILIPAS